MNQDPYSPNRFNSNPNGQNIEPNPVYHNHPTQPNINNNQIAPRNEYQLRPYQNQQHQNIAPIYQPYQPYPYQPPPPYLPAPNAAGNILQLSPMKVIVYLVLLGLGILVMVINKNNCQKYDGYYYYSYSYNNNYYYQDCSIYTALIITYSVSGGVYLLINLILLCMDRFNLPCYQLFLYSFPFNRHGCEDFCWGVLIGLFSVVVSVISIFVFIYFLIRYKCLNRDRGIQEGNMNVPPSNRNFVQRY